MVDLLKSKVKTWEKERGTDFLYDGESLVTTLENYCILKQERELERQRQRDQKKIYGQLIAEQKAIFGSKPSTAVSARKKKATPTGSASSKRYSMGGMMLKHPHSDKGTITSNPPKKITPCKTLTPQRHILSDFSVPKSGKKENPATGAKTHSWSSEAKQTRKPLSPISSSLSSKANSERA